MNLKVLQRADIDKVKWNSCVHYAEKGNPFGYLWFLDNISKDWFGIIEDDYHSVMPVFLETNFWGSTIFKSPKLLPFYQLYTVNALSHKRVDAFLELAMKHSKKLNIQQAFFKPQEVSFRIPQVNKQELITIDLSQNYTKVLNNLHPDLQALEHNIELDKYLLNSIKIEEASEAMASIHKLNKSDKFALMRLFYNAQQRQLGQVFALKDNTGQLLAVDFFFFSHGKMISFLPSSSKKGKAIQAEGIITTRLFKRFSGQPLRYYRNNLSLLPKQMSSDQFALDVFSIKN